MKRLICWLRGHKKVEVTKPMEGGSTLGDVRIVQDEQLGVVYYIQPSNMYYVWWECSRCGANNKPWGIE